MKLEKYVGTYVPMLVQSYNPDRYDALLQKKRKEFFRFVCITLAIAMTLFLITIIPMSIKYINTLPATLDQVQTFTVSGKIEADHVVDILTAPSVALDLPGNTSTAQYVLTTQGIVYPKYLYFGKTFVPWGDIANLKNPTAARNSILTGAVLFLLPSIIFWFFLYILVKLCAIFVSLVVLGYYVPRVLKHSISLKEVVKLAILAMPSVTLLGIGLYPLAPNLLFWWGLALTFILFSIGIALISERRRKV